MKKFFTAFIVSIIILLFIFHEKIVEKFIIYKLSNWIEKEVSFDNFKYEYPNLIKISGLEVINSNPIYNDNIFESELISIDLDLKTYLFEKLVIIKSLKIENPVFFLELNTKKSEAIDNDKNIKKNVFEDNIGVAKKINENLPDKI